MDSLSDEDSEVESIDKLNKKQNSLSDLGLKTELFILHKNIYRNIYKI